jgi:hypothetical protein
MAGHMLDGSLAVSDSLRGRIGSLTLPMVCDIAMRRGA